MKNIATNIITILLLLFALTSFGQDKTYYLECQDTTFYGDVNCYSCPTGTVGMEVFKGVAVKNLSGQTVALVPWPYTTKYANGFLEIESEREYIQGKPANFRAKFSEFIYPNVNSAFAILNECGCCGVQEGIVQSADSTVVFVTPGQLADSIKIGVSEIPFGDYDSTLASTAKLQYHDFGNGYTIQQLRYAESALSKEDMISLLDSNEVVKPMNFIKWHGGYMINLGDWKSFEVGTPGEYGNHLTSHNRFGTHSVAISPTNQLPQELQRRSYRASFDPAKGIDSLENVKPGRFLAEYYYAWSKKFGGYRNGFGNEIFLVEYQNGLPIFDWRVSQTLDGGTSPTNVLRMFKGDLYLYKYTALSAGATPLYDLSVQADGKVVPKQSVVQGAGIPAVAPAFIGQEYLDTTTGIFYKAAGLTSGDWKQFTQ